MPDYELSQQSKTVLQMTRDGLTSENIATGEKENVSHKKTDYEYHKSDDVDAAYNGMNQREYYNSQELNLDSHTLANSRMNPESVDDSEESEEAYKSPYNHGRYPLMDNNSLSDVNDKIADAIYEYRVTKYNKNKIKFERSKSKNTEAFERRPKEPELSSDKQELGSKKQEAQKLDKGTSKSFTRGAGKDSATQNKFDRKIYQADNKVRKLKDKLPSKTKLKFDRKEGRLKFEKNTLTKAQYLRIHSLAKGAWNSWSESRRKNRDEIPASMISKTRSGLRFVRQTHRHYQNAKRTINKYTNPYAKLERAESKAVEYRIRRDEADFRKMSPEQKKALKKSQRDMQKKIQKKRIQKNVFHQKHILGQQQSVKNRSFVTKAKDAVKKFVKLMKAFFSMVGAIIVIIIIVAALLLGGGFILAICIGYGGTAIIESTYQADYYQISDCSAYMQLLETDLKERISKIQEEYPGYYEYIYNLGDIKHNSIELISYLAAKFIEFDLETCQDEIDDLFGEMYNLIVEIVEEPREREKRDEDGNAIYDEEGNLVMETFMAEICYITLEVKPLNEIADSRLTAEEKKYFDTYMMSSGGQQVYGSCLVENWDNLISSKYGARIHPTTGERSFHNGIDIAVTVGTPLYSSTLGTVTTSAYSETAGNYIIITMENGWSIKYMHLDARNVSVGEVIVKGQNIGATGNTGRSTGPHLHLEVRDADDNSIDPTFIIPSKTVLIDK